MRIEKLRFGEVRILQGADALPATGIAGHQTEIIDYDLGSESRITLITVAALRQPSVALSQRCYFKVWNLDPSGYH